MSVKDSATPLFTIITVVYNGEVNLEATIHNLLTQTCQDFEYIIVDGGSTDRTPAIIRQYSHRINKWISEPDKGIYDAMNKGIGMASGKYINFLNVGDALYNENTLQDVASFIAGQSGEAPEIVYGKALRKSGGAKPISFEKKNIISETTLFNSIPFCHQTLFLSRGLFESIGRYSLDFKIVADYEWLVRYFNDRKTFRRVAFINQFVSCYDETGYSFQNIQHANKEKIKVARRHFRGTKLYSGQFIFSLGLVKGYIVKFMAQTGLLHYYRVLKYKQVY